MKRSLALLLLFILQGFNLAADAQPPVLNSPLLTILDAGGKTPLGAWVNGVNGCKAERDKPSGHITGLFSGGNQQLRIAFHGHSKPEVGTFSADPSARLLLRARSPEGLSGDLRWGWYGEGQQAAAASAALTVALRGEEWSELLLPMPAAPEGARATGLYLSAPAGTLEIAEAAVIAQRMVRLESIPKDALLHAGKLTVSGEAAPGVTQIELRVRTAAKDGGREVLSRKAPVRDGRFAVDFTRAELAAYAENEFTALAAGLPADGREASTPVSAFAYPEQTGKTLPPLAVREGMLVQMLPDQKAKPFGFVGLNYTQFQLNLGRRESYELLARDVNQLAGWGISAVRVTLNIGMLQPEEGLFPDAPRYEDALKEHRLTPEWFRMLEYFIALAGERGIYTVFDWHEYPTHPYRYFAGGEEKDKGTGKPGTAVAWLCPDRTSTVAFDMSNPRHLKAILETNRWVARRFKGNPNLLGIEVPFNEPHCRYMNNQANWAAVTSACARAVKEQDPARLTFSMPAGWGHENTSWTSTWMPPEYVDGQAPHHYIANGPIPPRPGADKMKMSWLCRDIEQTFALSLPAVLLPRGTRNQPIYNGEGGEWGSEVFLPDIDSALANDCMYEATLAQSYAAGLVGHMNWICFDNDRAYDKTIYADHAPRYARVFAEGPLDWSKAELAFIQNSAAGSTANNHNHGAVALTELMLALHLAPVHYLADDEILYRGISRQTAGLEQVTDASASFAGYKCLIVDRRNLDRRVEEAIKGAKLPVLWTDDPQQLSKEEVAAFLQKNGIHADLRTPEGIQLAVGPKHVVAFRRRGQAATDTIYPAVRREGSFELIDEAGTTVFRGTSKQLQETGLRLSLGKWRSAILTIR